MFDLTIKVSSGRTFDGYECKIISQGEAVCAEWKIPEDAEVAFHLITSNKALSLGKPQIYIGDVIHFFELTSISDEDKVWKATFDEDEYCGFPFRNFVGRSEIILTFQDSDIRIRNLVDIQASPINAELAEGMLTYLSNHYESIVSICFSRSKISGDTIKGDEDSLNRLIEEAQSGIGLCELLWPELLARVRERWDITLESQSNTLPNSPQGIAWLAQHPENIHFCSKNEQMFSVDGYPVLTTKSIRECLSHNRNLYENRVIHGYLAHLEQKLGSAKAMIEKEHKLNGTNRNFEISGYISLDYILCKYKAPILLGLMENLTSLISRTKFLRKRLSAKVPFPKELRPLQPCVTPFVSRTPSYLKIFEKISKWYEFGKVQIGVGDLLFGLRHLSTLYEFTVLTQLISALKMIGYHLTESSWRDFEDVKFGGKVMPRPSNAINNYFHFVDHTRKMRIELFYEPKIWTKHNAQFGDPVDVCIEHQGKDWQHRKPDYVLRVWFDGVEEPILLIFDAKFSSAYKVRTEKLPDIVNKYLLGLHQKKIGGGYGQLPIQAVWAIYPKGNSEKVNFYASYHSLGGVDNILPSICGLRVRPTDEDYLLRMLKKLINQIYSEFSIQSDSSSIHNLIKLKIA